MKSLLVLILFFLISISGCREVAVTIPFNASFILKYKQIKTFPDQAASISLDSVINDSRCPTGAMCVWVGNAEVRFIYTKDNQKRTFILNTLSSFRTDTLLDDYRIKLIRLNPYPQAGIPIIQNDYNAELEITKE